MLMLHFSYFDSKMVKTLDNVETMETFTSLIIMTM